MRYLKLYENFSSGKDIWVLMDENEEYVFAESFTSVRKGMTFVSNRMVAIDDVSMDSFSKHSYTSEERALISIQYISPQNNIELKIKISARKSK